MLAITQFGAVQAASHPGTPSNGTSGTGANQLDKGALLTDTTNGVLYINTGTKASPAWTKVGNQT